MQKLKFSLKHLNDKERLEILELLFSLGYKWLDGTTEVKHLNADYFYTDLNQVYWGNSYTVFNSKDSYNWVSLLQLRKLVHNKKLENKKLPNKDKLINLELTLKQALALYCITGSIGGNTLIRHTLSSVYRKIDPEVRENLGYDYTFLAQPVDEVSISNLNEAYVIGCRKIFNTKTEEELEIEELNKTILLAENKIREILSKKESK